MRCVYIYRWLRNLKFVSSYNDVKLNTTIVLEFIVKYYKHFVNFVNICGMKLSSRESLTHGRFPFSVGYNINTLFF